MVDESEMQALRAQIDALHQGAKTDRTAADTSRADIEHLHKQGRVDRADIDALQIAAEVDRHLIAELQAEGVLHAEHSRQMEAALVSARRIGAAIGIVMMISRCTQQEALDALKKISNDTNRKLRDIAEDVLLTGDLGHFPTN